MTEFQLQQIGEAARERLAGKSSHVWKEPSNKYDHGIRTAILAKKLKAEIGICADETDDRILTAAAWLHDICNADGEADHEKVGAELLPELIGAYCSDTELERIMRMVRVHDTRLKDVPLDERLKVYSPDILILQDADLLDHLGTYSVWATFSDLVYRRKTPYDYTAAFRNGAFDRFAERWRIRINYPQSLVIYEEKIAFETEFAARMIRELNGEYC
ncbi:MAG: HD domain-containing protein [Eubacteriales bacterium]